MIAVSDDLDELLRLWWHAERMGSVAMGYPTECPSTRGYRARNRDTSDEADSLHFSLVVARIDAAIERLEPAHRSAIHVIARNLATGSSVWSSARIPAGAEGQAVFAAAAAALSRSLGLPAELPN